MNDKWISVKDRLPEVDQEVLCVYLDSENKMEVAILSILAPAFRIVEEENGIEYLGFWENPFGDYISFKKEAVIYWMPLPEFPNE